MRCEYCDKNFPMTLLRFVPAGSVKGIIGMKRNKAQCQSCAGLKKRIAIDDTTKMSRVPGDDDEPTTEQEYPF